ncbi:MAG: hypothetical protein ABSD98_05970 [Candidatus Korobacteraceae bacterium]|jgi:hypothetical protein
MGQETNTAISPAGGAESGRRVLILVPIIHTPADMGELKEPIQRLKVRKLGKKAWERNQDLVETFWKQLEETIDGLRLPYERARLYQDGLPVCGHELEIVADMGKVGSRNYLLLLKLKDKGATLMGTESAELLVEEYQLAKAVYGRQRPEGAGRGKSNAQALENSLLKRRDQFIGRRISSTLQNGETGLIFLGMLHAIEPWLDKDIRVLRPARQGLHRGGPRP